MEAGIMCFVLPCRVVTRRATRWKKGPPTLREAIELYLGTLIEDGLPIPHEDIFIKPIEISA